MEHVIVSVTVDTLPFTMRTPDRTTRVQKTRCASPSRFPFTLYPTRERPHPRRKINQTKHELVAVADEPLLTIPLSIHKRSKQTAALVDTGASANFIEEQLANGFHLKPPRLLADKSVAGAWGSSITMTHYVNIRFHHHDSSYEETFYIVPTKLPRPLVLGLPFLRANPTLLRALIPDRPPVSANLSFIGPRRARRMLRCLDNEAFLLWVSDQDQPVSTTLSKDIIDHYGDVVVDELRKRSGGGTTSTPTIQHHITLKPEAAPVAKRAYRLSPADQHRKK